MELILASSSPYRRELLERLRLPFRVEKPQVDESALPGEPPRELVTRLAEAKARKIAGTQPSAWVIGADQIALCDGEILGKPGTADKARMQLMRMQGKRIDFLNGLSLIGPDFCRTRCEVYSIWLRPLDAASITRYLEADKPWECAGSFRSESLGISLVERMAGDDPNALMGLPLIALCAMLREAGWQLP
ncbi:MULTISPECIES: Maf family protein [Acidithiobacillus]|jgi:septum formation protein|uniref:7-methyl-GTP pyrophosphatase n=3 Tax=Acidithiobacillus caldus TaxID=33059 RepID=F9ZP63_ACICS|nr:MULTISPECIES: Maf family nucleotide pyrophosphatase [Acidithiobacillus]AEK58440.1 maf protein [Acidithiobacillus caldus SM-1]AIA55408.1 Maf/YceF/YhdE family protein [Acidithiobacillus caldus ATCC 51756]AUW33030.1 septum formation inhibitor Maf [Acidithiobacillus caldus]MBU2729521.1 septum formation inhibitor Maf [Acidithiobacillus caldus]MBU2734868.1 septum formation inhibitor Maf [Acidithiobacillus caldus ATCC 51756]